MPFPSSAGACAVAFKRDGRIVVVGSAIKGNSAFYAVAVLNQDGSLDNSFAGGAGRRIYDMVAPDGVNINTRSNARAVAIQSVGDDDNIILAGCGVLSGKDTFQVVRITCDGDLDTTFGTNGAEVITFNPNATSEFARGVDIRPDGRIVAVGISFTALVNQLVVGQLQINGALDTMNFGAGTGKVTFPNADGFAVNIQKDQKIIVVGVDDLTVQSNFLLVRFTAEGTLDTATFNPNNGFVRTIFAGQSGAVAVALQCDGKIVAAGSAGSEIAQFALARYLNENGNDEVIVEPTITQPTNLGNCNTPQPTFSGAAQNPANITVYIDGQEAGRVITEGSKNEWLFTPPAPLSTGSHTVQTVAEYKSGNQNCITTLCCGVCLGCQSCLSEALRPKYCPSCVDFPIC